ncbi:sulfurtransferase TusA family protein [Plantactinospora sp. CA-290183]|uniref:sulfurtransferase TusA family protein n=1 Tax=Plantactinospora sp. CA-290183 TaxID=3240006 RepID=UPI003D8DF7C9
MPGLRDHDQGQDESGEPRTGTPDEVVDCLGQRCPLPVIAAARRLTGLPVGGMLRVLADDPAAAIDIPAWCRMRGQELVGTSTVDGSPAYDIRRAH